MNIKLDARLLLPPAAAVAPVASGATKGFFDETLSKKEKQGNVRFLTLREVSRK